MMFKFMTLSLLTICAAENVIMLPRRKNEEAFSPHVHRHELPHIFGVPDFLTRSKVVNQHTENFPPNYYEKIQYAPLHEQIAQNVKSTATEYTKAPPTTSGISATSAELVFHTKAKKDHLEPRVNNISQEPVMKCFSHGNIDASVSRSPGHNAVYRTLSEAVRRDDLLQILPRQNLQGVNHLVGPYAMYQNVDIMTTTMLPFQLPRETSRPFAFSNRHFVLNPNLVESPGKQMEKNKRHYSPYAKFHRLHLNIARVYSPGQVPIKPLTFADTSYSLGIGKHESYIPPLFKAISDHKTVLYPKSSPKSYRFVLP